MKGPVTSCDAPAGAYAFFAPTVVMPPCTKAMHPSTVPGAAACPTLAAAAFDNAFNLRRRGITPVTAAPAAAK